MKTKQSFWALSPRDPAESHRAATPLELFFDLVSVIAIAAAAVGLHHAIANDHVVDGLIHFCAAFFMVWWAWMNYTWYASAYDNDDTVFRLLTMLSIAGSLIIAAGIQAFFASNALLTIVLGFIIMRLALVALWLRAAQHDKAARKTALWYAGGIILAQIYWVLIAFNPSDDLSVFGQLFLLGVLLELSVPALAERQGKTPWHRHHMIERYGLLNIIVLGESLLAASMALREASQHHFDAALVQIAVVALVIVFSMWWLYFSREDHLSDSSRRQAFIWGYGHVLIFLGGAAVGAGLAVQVDIATGHAHIPAIAGDLAVALPAALYALGLWMVRDRILLTGAMRLGMPVLVALIAVLPAYFGMEVLALLLPLTVYLRNRAASAA